VSCAGSVRLLLISLFFRTHKRQTKADLDLFGFRELRREKVWSRIHLVPLLLAEGDRDAHRRHLAAVEREKEIMKGVAGWQVRLQDFSD